VEECETEKGLGGIIRWDVEPIEVSKSAQHRKLVLGRRLSGVMVVMVLLIVMLRLVRASVVAVKLSRVGVHDLLCMRKGVLMLVGRHFLVWLALGQFVGRWEKVHDPASACRSLVDGEGCSELPMRSNLNCIQEPSREILAIIAAQNVCRALLSHVVDGHLAWDRLVGRPTETEERSSRTHWLGGEPHH
jgi:hypothetical protein